MSEGEQVNRAARRKAERVLRLRQAVRRKPKRKRVKRRR